MPASFVNLPSELQLFLFSFFTHEELCKTLAPVCQHWWELSKDPTLWKSLEIEVRKEDQTRSLSSLLLRSPMLTKLEIYTEFYLEEFAVYSRWCPMLTHLDLRECTNVDHRIVVLFVQNCPLIEELNVFDCDQIEEKSVSSIVSLQHLRVLDISHCHLVDDNCIQLITENCKHLEDLKVGSESSNITDTAIRSLTENLHPTLLRLELYGCETNANLTDLALSRIGLCTRLQHLFISYIDQVTDQLLGSMKMLTDLRTLTLHRTLSISTVALNNHFAGSHVHNLVKLKLIQCTINDDGMYNITQNCKLLRKLKLATCKKVTEVGVEHIVKHCEYLTHLTVICMDHVTGFCLQSVPRTLSRLEFLSFRRCVGVIQSVLVELQVRMPKLEVIHY